MVCLCNISTVLIISNSCHVLAHYSMNKSIDQDLKIIIVLNVYFRIFIAYIFSHTTRKFVYKKN
jgi:hypothetical protein